jgi:hypothetical protein
MSYSAGSDISSDGAAATTTGGATGAAADGAIGVLGVGPVAGAAPAHAAIAAIHAQIRIAAIVPAMQPRSQNLTITAIRTSARTA